jgi:hypothetical protein
VALEIDSSQPLRRPADRRRLIEAIRDAPAYEPELECVEWKSLVDLAEKRWKAQIARQVLGLGNRDPDSAARMFDGCAYLILGVEPRNLCGVRPIDAAELETGVAPYVGTEGPQWDFHFEEVAGVTVLVISVEPPRWGDPPFRLQKEISFDDEDGSTIHWRSGDTFVRKGAKTEKANAADLERLDKRLLKRAEQQSRLKIAVSWPSEDPVTVKPVEINKQAQEAWLEAERKQLFSPLKQFDEASPERRPEFLDADLRSPAQYKMEVETYLAKAENKLLAELPFRALDHRDTIGSLSLELKNLTEDNFAAVRVEVNFDHEGVVAAFDRYDLGERDIGHFPERPIIWGRASRPLDLLKGWRQPTLLPPITPLSVREPNGWVENLDASVMLRFRPVNLRPLDQVELAPVLLMVDARHAGQQLDGRWFATANNVSGRQEGQLTVQIHEQALTPAALIGYP